LVYSGVSEPKVIDISVTVSSRLELGKSQLAMQGVLTEPEGSMKVWSLLRTMLLVGHT
jgi:hypothetical protein